MKRRIAKEYFQNRGYGGMDSTNNGVKDITEKIQKDLNEHFQEYNLIHLSHSISNCESNGEFIASAIAIFEQREATRS